MTRSGASASDVVSSSGVRAKTSAVPTIRAVSLIRATKNRSLTTATTLIDIHSQHAVRPARSVILFLVPQPVPVPLREMGQRREVAHSVEVDHPLEVVGLVLDDAGEELLGLAFDRIPLAVIG